VGRSGSGAFGQQLSFDLRHARHYADAVVKLADQWAAVETDLPPDWEELRLTLTTEQPSDLARAAQMLGPMNPGRAGETLVLHVRRGGGMAGPEAARRLFSRLDRDRVWCVLDPGEATIAEPVVTTPRVSLAEQWDALLGTLPGDWSDALCELRLDSSELLPGASLRCAALNPTRDPEIIGFVFRCARIAGYGVSPSMARRSFEGLDADGIGASVGLRRLLSASGHYDTQGPVWLADGRTL
jgi:hypothetical protein